MNKQDITNLSNLYMESQYNNNMNESKIIYVVYERDRGWGTTIVAAYTDRDKAEKHALQDRHHYYDAVELHQ